MSNGNDRVYYIILKSGEIYRKKFLDKNFLRERLSINVSELKKNKLEALKFFFSRVLFQGRRDELSEKVYGYVKEVLEDCLQRFGKIDEKICEDKLKEIKENKGKIRGRDIELVTGTLKKLKEFKEFKDENIVTYSIKKIQKGNIKELYNELNKIRGIGQKTSSLFLRDLVLLFELKINKKEDAMYLQPIDTWVRKGLEILFGIKDKNDKELKRKIVNICKSVEDSVKFNAGLWIIGTHPYVILNELFKDF